MTQRKARNVPNRRQQQPGPDLRLGVEDYAQRGYWWHPFSETLSAWFIQTVLFLLYKVSIKAYSGGVSICTQTRLSDDLISQLRIETFRIFMNILVAPCALQLVRVLLKVSWENTDHDNLLRHWTSPGPHIIKMNARKILNIYQRNSFLHHFHWEINPCVIINSK